jgi:hypothetical protein
MIIIFFGNLEIEFGRRRYCHVMVLNAARKQKPSVKRENDQSRVTCTY